MGSAYGPSDIRAIPKPPCGSIAADRLNYVREPRELKGACGRCAYKWVYGGCRYNAFALTGN